MTPGSLVGLGRDYPEGMERYLDLPFPVPSQIEGADKDAAWRETWPRRRPDG